MSVSGKLRFPVAYRDTLSRILRVSQSYPQGTSVIYLGIPCLKCAAGHNNYRGKIVVDVRKNYIFVRRVRYS